MKSSGGLESFHSFFVILIVHNNICNMALELLLSPNRAISIATSIHDSVTLHITLYAKPIFLSLN